MHIYKYFYVTIRICIKLNIYKHFTQPFMSVLRHKDVPNSNPLSRGLIYRLLLLISSGVASHSNWEKSDYQYLPLFYFFISYVQIQEFQTLPNPPKFRLPLFSVLVNVTTLYLIVLAKNTLEISLKVYSFISHN